MNTSITLQHVLRESNGALLVPLKVAARICGLEPQTIRNNKNKISGHKSLMLGVRYGSRIFFKAVEIAEYIDTESQETLSNEKAKRGRPRKSTKASQQPVT